MEFGEAFTEYRTYELSLGGGGGSLLSQERGGKKKGTARRGTGKTTDTAC